MKIIALSDMHGFLPELEPCDVVCICGDIIPLEIQCKIGDSVHWLAKTFEPWVQRLNCSKVILVAGNHDFAIQEIHENLGGDFFMRLGVNKNHKIIYLQDDSYEIDGIMFYGTPWVSNLKGWAFYKSDDDLKEAFSEIPNDVDVLLTHQPSNLNQMGLVLQHGWNCLKDFGCKILGDEVLLKHPRWHLAGHVHSGNHDITEIGNTKMANVSLKDEKYAVTYKPLTFEINKR